MFPFGVGRLTAICILQLLYFQLNPSHPADNLQNVLKFPLLRITKQIQKKKKTNVSHNNNQLKFPIQA